MDMIKIGIIGITGVFIAVYLRNVKAEYGVYVGAATGLIIFSLAVKDMAVFMDEFKALELMTTQERSFFGILLKVIGISYICEFCAGICKDAGYGAVGSQVTMFGKILVLLTGLPILLSVIQTIQNFKR